MPPAPRPWLVADRVYNSALVLANGGIVARYDKRELPNYGVFDEERMFSPGRRNVAIESGGGLLAVTVCEDIWLPDGVVSEAVGAGAACLLNISASPYDLGKGLSRDAFLEKYKLLASPHFDPDIHLARVGVANQTTMMRGETEEVQRRIMAAVRDRDGDTGVKENYRFFDTICGATQERQDALKDMLQKKMDLLLVIGGYNSSNTSHLAEMGEALLPTYFIRNAGKLESSDHIVHFDQHASHEVTTEKWLPASPATIGITAGASCPNNLIEDTILRIFELFGIPRERVLP